MDVSQKRDETVYPYETTWRGRGSRPRTSTWPRRARLPGCGRDRARPPRRGAGLDVAARIEPMVRIEAVATSTQESLLVRFQPVASSPAVAKTKAAHVAVPPGNGSIFAGQVAAVASWPAWSQARIEPVTGIEGKHLAPASHGASTRRTTSPGSRAGRQRTGDRGRGHRRVLAGRRGAKRLQKAAPASLRSGPLIGPGYVGVLAQSNRFPR